jgi:hypothetical protein
LAVFYKGSISFKDLEEMPVDRLIDLNEYAKRIIKESESKK